MTQHPNKMSIYFREQDRDLIDKLKSLAVQDDRSLNYVVVRALGEFVEQRGYTRPT